MTNPKGSTQPIMVQVAAPATLSEGFQFDATFDGTQFTVTVPKGGVTQGQMFEVPFIPRSGGTTNKGSGTGGTTGGGYPSTYQSGGGGGSGTTTGGGSSGGGRGMDGTFHSNDNAFSTLEENDPHHIPRGQWRDGLFDCFTLGPFHPSLIMALVCHSCLNAQVMTRLRLTFLGEPSLVGEYSNPNHWQHWRHTFKNCVILVIVYMILSQIFSIPSPNYETLTDEVTGEVVLQNTTPPPSRFTVMMNNLLNISMASYSIITMIRARRMIRQRYHIPEHHLVSESAFANMGVEDCMLSICCSCCTVSQMARHTADYAHGDHAMFCTSNGLAIPEHEDTTSAADGDGPFPPAYAPHSSSTMVV